MTYDPICWYSTHQPLRYLLQRRRDDRDGSNCDEPKASAARPLYLQHRTYLDGARSSESGHNRKSRPLFKVGELEYLFSVARGVHLKLLRRRFLQLAAGAADRPAMS
jgi:hypothetical protein